MPINELIEVIMKSVAGEEVLSSKFWVLSFKRARLVGLVYLVSFVQPNKQDKPNKPNKRVIRSIPVPYV